jgi:hypothetical protein
VRRGRRWLRRRFRQASLVVRRPPRRWPPACSPFRWKSVRRWNCFAILVRT